MWPYLTRTAHRQNPLNAVTVGTYGVYRPTFDTGMCYRDLIMEPASARLHTTLGTP